MSVGVAGHQSQHIAQQCGNVFPKQQSWQQRFQGGMHISSVDTNRFGQIGLFAGAQGGQSLQVVAQHFGGYILRHRLLRQARDVLQAEVMPEPLESLLDTPALVLKIAERAGREARRIEQVGHQNTHLTFGRNVTHQPHGLGFNRAAKVLHVSPLGSAQRDHLLQERAALEIAHASKARVGGLLDRHAKRDGALIQCCHQPATRVATVEQQQISAREPVEVLKEHLPLVFMDTVQRGGEHQLRTGQEQAKEDLVGQGGAFDVTGAQTKTHSGCVGGDQTQAVSTGHKTIVLGTLDHPVLSSGMAVKDSLARA